MSVPLLGLIGRLRRKVESLKESFSCGFMAVGPTIFALSTSTVIVLSFPTIVYVFSVKASSWGVNHFSDSEPTRISRHQVD